MKMLRPLRSALGMLWLAGPFIPCHSADWPQWRGPQRDGTSVETGWSDTWSPSGPKVAWRAKVGLGFSSVVVAEGKAYTMGHSDGKDSVFCFDLQTGSEVWKQSYASELGDKYFDGGTTGTPTVSGGRLYTLNRWGETHCFNAVDGKIQWSKNIQTETSATVPDWGFSGAPLILDRQLFLNVGEGGLALDSKDGRILWKSAPKSAGYSTPLPVTAGAESQVVFSSDKGYAGVNPKDGKELWRIRWLTQYGVNAADPIVSGDQVFLSTGYSKGAGMFKLGKAEPDQLWKSKSLHTQLNAAVLYQGYLYGVDGDTSGKAALKCVEFATGNERWSVPDFGTGGVIIAGGKLIALSGVGELLIAAAAPSGFNPSARAQVLGGKCWTAPVLADGRILVRNSRGEIACLDVRK